MPERTQEGSGVGHDLHSPTDKGALLAIVSVSGRTPRTTGKSPLVANDG